MTEAERISAAGEWVLGTLPPAERAAFRARLLMDPAAAADVRAFEAGLMPLLLDAASVEPSAALWPAIEARLPSEVPAAPARPAPGGWRAFGIAASILAAALGAALFLRQPVVMPPARAPITTVAALSEGGAKAGLLLSFDAATGTLLAQPVALRPQAGRSFQLWWIVGAGAPRPVGLLNPARPVAFRLAPGAAVEGTSFAVSIEPEGGSPTGQPTGPIPYSGSALRIAQPS